MNEDSKKTLTLGPGVRAREQVVVEVDPTVWVSIDTLLEETNPDDGYDLAELRAWLKHLRGDGPEGAEEYPFDRGLEGAEDAAEEAAE